MRKAYTPNARFFFRFLADKFIRISCTDRGGRRNNSLGERPDTVLVSRLFLFVISGYKMLVYRGNNFNT